jgi:hypothetical protein
MFSSLIARRPLRPALAAALGAVLIGLAAGAVSFTLFPITHGADFAQFHYHARQWLAGRDPYAGGFPIMRATRIVPEPLFYPFPTVLAVAPFALAPLRIAATAFVAASTALLAFGLIRHAPHQLPMFLGAGYIVALGLGQWTPLVTATFVVPALAWLAVLKPNIGLATTAAKPSIFGALGGLVLLLGTLALQPNWPYEWLRNLRVMPGHPAPIQVPGGVLLLVGLLRWRRREARLIVAMGCVPQLLYFADQLPLWLVPQTRRESMCLSTTSLLAWTLALTLATRAGQQPAFSSNVAVLLGVYAPALLMVLRRPNEGALPDWLERGVAPLPVWLAGRPLQVEGTCGSSRA